MCAQETGTTCRERCGGQGYLSVNKFGAIIGFAHAGMTAEGDNRVLMQKVAKEYLSTLDQAQVRDRLRAGSSPPNLSGEATGTSASCTNRSELVANAKKYSCSMFRVSPLALSFFGGTLLFPRSH